jgi:hypothetical protein
LIAIHPAMPATAQSYSAIGELDALRVTCSQCERDGCYGLSRLINQRGRDANIIDWLG